jgi:aldehyde dehydrogenase (NAD+)
VIKGLKEMQDELCEAMRLDLGRDPFLNYVGEVAFVEAGARFDIAHLNEWRQDHREKMELILAPGQVYTRYEPLGVVAVIGSWNAPMVTTLKPLVQAITAGNCCIVKPSEISAHSSAAIKKLCDTYLD